MTKEPELLPGTPLPWIVWSNEHRAFWNPNRAGYTQRIENAGRYTQDEAETICRGANYRSNSRLNHGTPPEICMPAPEALDAYPTLLARIEALTSALHQYRSDMLYPPLADSRERRIAMIDALNTPPRSKDREYG